MIKKLISSLLIFFLGCSNPDSSVLNFEKRKPLYNKIIIDVVYVEEAKPDPESLKFLETKIKKYHLCKKFEIHQRCTTIISEPPWNTASLKFFELANKVIYEKKEGELRLFILYLPGQYIQEKINGLAGIQYAPYAFAIFKDSVKTCENSALLHEFGHVLEIADDTHSPDRKPINPDRPNHCNNKECCMFWRLGDNNQDFDESCQKELLRLFK